LERGPQRPPAGCELAARVDLVAPRREWAAAALKAGNAWTARDHWFVLGYEDGRITATER
jgi:hypothetical protein